jgi:hypothetical protein
MILPEIIVKSFLKTGISNALDGSEDATIWVDGGLDGVQKERALKTENDRTRTDETFF